MKASSYYRSNFRRQTEPGPALCLQCGQRVKRGGAWHGAGVTVYLCGSCAETHPKALAALLADAIADSRDPNQQYHALTRALRRFETYAWEALALKLGGQ